METYIVMRQSPRVHQMTIEEFYSDDDYTPNSVGGPADTRTFVANKLVTLKNRDKAAALVQKLKDFNQKYEQLRAAERKTLYREFFIPKKTGGWRRIDAPEDDLKNALYELKGILEKDFGALYHTSAFAYVKKRCTVDCVKRHQSNHSRWFAKFDLHDFFGSTTLDFVMSMFERVFPFGDIMAHGGREELRKALELAFLNGGLPQGTPLSPTITNVMMIPVDFTLSKALRNFNGNSFVYTRYADDFIVSSQYDFKVGEVEELIVNTLKGFSAPFTLNQEKTRYGSSAGRNWNLGVMLNSENRITIGYKKKKRFQAALASYVMDNKNGKPWDKADVQVLAGYMAYYKMVEGNSIDELIKKVGDKFSVNIKEMVKADLAA